MDFLLCERSENTELRIIQETRAKANNFYKPRMCTNTFAYSAIDEWNSLPNHIKSMKNEKTFKDSLKKTILKDARKSDESPFVYY